MQNKLVFNPFLPLNEYIPDGEPHVFGDRVYIFGSHDREGGYTFCMENYVTYSAPVTDLSDWRYEGIIYRAEQDSLFSKLKYMYAPDVVCGNDGKYYLFYCMGGDYGEGGYQETINVAVCDTPGGKYEYLGFVRNPDGSPMKKYICFDPAVINDNGVIRVYYGTQYDYEEREDFSENEEYIKKEIEMFGRTKEEILSYPDSIMGACMLTLEDDMLTVKQEAQHIIPYKVKNTSFETHPFFEGSSIRKVGDKYYFIYSSMQNHELCYAVSAYPDKDFVFGGTIVSNGDIGFNGRAESQRLNMTGTTHGSIECINGSWYVFFHRLTHKSDYSRQACAEKIHIENDGSIKQVQITSCGLSEKGYLPSEGKYPAVIACNLTNGKMPHGSNSIYQIPFPNVTHKNNERFIAEIEDNTLIGYKYFSFDGTRDFFVEARIENDSNRVISDAPLRVDERCRELFTDLSKQQHNNAECDNIIAYFDVYTDINDKSLGRISLDKTDDWNNYTAEISFPRGVHPLFLVYHGNVRLQLKTIGFGKP